MVKESVIKQQVHSTRDSGLKEKKIKGEDKFMKMEMCLRANELWIMQTVKEFTNRLMGINVREIEKIMPWMDLESKKARMDHLMKEPFKMGRKMERGNSYEQMGHSKKVIFQLNNSNRGLKK